MKAWKLRARWRSDAFAIVHRSSSAVDKPWRVSFFDDDGPVGHTCRDTAEECLKVAKQDDYVVEEIR